MTINPTIKAYFARLGQKGGRSRSPRKAQASKANGAKRKVYIELKHDTWCIYYASRNKYQNYMAGQFYAKDHSLEFVREWVSKQPRLTLVMSPIDNLANDNPSPLGLSSSLG